MKHIGARMRDCFLIKDKTITLRSVMSRDSENRRVDSEKRRELSSLMPFSGLDTPSSPLHPYSIAIFDTCALLHTKDILETTIKRNVIAVVPCTVIEELGRHESTGSERIKHLASQVIRSIDTFEEDPLFFTENPKAMRKKMTGIDMHNPDDKILKCALRVHKHMSYKKRTIWFVTNDKELQLKATERGASIIVIEAQKFMDGMKMKKKNRSEKLIEADDLEKLRICLTQPKQTPESTAEKKPSTRIPNDKKKDEDKQQQPLQQSESKTEKAEKKPSTLTPEDKKEQP